jgi:hypothetical protein
MEMRSVTISLCVLLAVTSAATGAPEVKSGGVQPPSTAAAGSRSGVPARLRHDADKLISTLRFSGQARVRAQAALALGAYDNDPAVTEALLTALSDSHVMVRSSAARGLMALAPWERFPQICAYGMAETEPFARTWIQKAAARAAGAAPKVLINVDAMDCVSGENRGPTGQKLRSAFLEKVFSYDGYSVGVALDFSDEGGSDSIKGVEIAIVGDLTTTGTKQKGSATLDIRAVAPGGFVVWSAVIEVVDADQGRAPEINDPYADEYTIREEGEDARLVATGIAAVKAATRLNVELRGVE